MKKYLHYFLCTAAIAAFTACSDDDDYGNDSVFTTYCLEHFDSNRNGVIEVEEVDTVTYLDVHKMGITSLKGIENFTALKELHCKSNRLTVLDVSKNTALTVLDCDNNQLTALDVSKNTELMGLFCENNRLTALDVSKNTALEFLYCENCQLTTLNVNKNTILRYLLCGTNQLTALDVSKNTILAGLQCYGNQIQILDVSKANLHFLDCAPMKTLQTLYLKTGWELEGINKNRDIRCVPAQTEIKYKK